MHIIDNSVQRYFSRYSKWRSEFASPTKKSDFSTSLYNHCKSPIPPSQSYNFYLNLVYISFIQRPIMILSLRSLASAICLALACYSGSALAAQPPEIDARGLPPAACSAVNRIVSILKFQKATAFCSSFLSIPMQTATATVTTSSTLPAVTDVITSTVIVPSATTM